MLFIKPDSGLFIKYNTKNEKSSKNLDLIFERGDESRFAGSYSR